MGRIIKAGEGSRAGAQSTPVRAADRDDVAADLTEVLLAARRAAEAERVAAKGVAVLLARKMAEKIVGHAVDLEPTVMSDIVEQALQASRPGGPALLLRVHPADLSALEAHPPRWLQGAGPALRMLADASVGRYGCVVDTPAGRVDARLGTQLDVLERVLGAALEG